MDEARWLIFYLSRKRSMRNRALHRKKQQGQAIIEFLLVMVLALMFTRFVFFNREYGFQAMLEKTMLRLGVHLEQNLKAGVQVQDDKETFKSLQPYSGIGRWTN